MAWTIFKFLSVALLILSGVHSQELLQPPLITQPDRAQTKYFAEDERVVVKCEAIGTPKPTYTWQRNEKNIESDNAYIKFDSRTGTLAIPKFSQREEGLFVCLASNNVGGNVAVSFSNPQELLAARVGIFKVTGAKPREINSNEYAYAKLDCTDQGEVVGAKDDITYKWYITQESQQVKTDDGRLFISSDGSLHFTYTLLGDELDGSDTYHCGISSLKSRLIRLGPSMVLKVQKSDPAALKPVIVHHNNRLEAKLGTSAELECVFSGYDPDANDRLPTIKWFDDAGNEIIDDAKKYKLSDKNRILSIYDLQESDDRVFACQGTTSAGSSRKQNVYLNVTSAPKWVEAPKGKTVPANSDVKINCNARSLSGEEPPLSPIWYINGQEFEKVGKSNAVLSDDRKVVTFSNVSKENDILCVQCVVKNSEGQTMGDACINVVAPIKISMDCDRCSNSDEKCSCTKWEVSKGEAIQFRLAAATEPSLMDKLTLQWTYQNTTYKLPNLPPLWTRDPITQSYVLNTTLMSEKEFASLKGLYQFKVFHSFESKGVDVTIAVKGVTPAPSPIPYDTSNTSTAAPIVQSASGGEMWIIGLVIGLAFLLILILIIIFYIVCRKQQEGVYYLGKKETGAGLDPASELKDKAFHDLSRPDYEDYEYPDKKPKGELEYDDVPIEADDESLGEYGDEDDLHFNEDGSFIGNYSVKPSNHRTTESTI